MAANGVLEYDEATVRIFFPKGKICCDLCPILETYARKQCRRTGEYIFDTRGRGMWCPLETEEDHGESDLCDG